MYNIWICLMRLIRVFNFNLLGHIAQPPCQGRTTVRGRQTHGLYTALFNGPWMRKFEQNPAEKCKTSIYRNFIAFLSQLYRFFLRKITVFRSNSDIFALKCEKSCRFQVRLWHFRTQMRKIVRTVLSQMPVMTSVVWWHYLNPNPQDTPCACWSSDMQLLLPSLHPPRDPSSPSCQRTGWWGLGNPPDRRRALQCKLMEGKGTRWDCFHVIFGGNSKCQKMESHLGDIHEQLTPSLVWEEPI